MSELISRAYRFRFYPTEEQKEQLENTFGSVRFVYNYFLERRQSEWNNHKKSMSYVDTAKELTQLKSAKPWLCAISNVCLQQLLRALDRGFKNFFQKRTRHPTYKRKHGKQSVRYMQNGVTYHAGTVKLAKQKTYLNIRVSKQLPSG